VKEREGFGRRGGERGERREERGERERESFLKKRSDLFNGAGKKRISFDISVGKSVFVTW